MKEISYQEWERRETYAFFSGYSNPFYMVTFRQDVTRLHQYTKAHGLSFYEGMIWACTEAVNRVRAFRYAMHHGTPVLLDGRSPSFTDLKKDSEQFYIVTMEHLPDIDAFCCEASRLSQQQESFIDPEKESPDLIYYSCLPWLDLTALTHDRDFSAPEALDDSIPRITWGRYSEENGRKTLGVSIEVNHRFIDGVHIGRFAEHLSQIMDQLQP